LTYGGLTVRGDAASCPLAFGLDTYYNCEYNCSYCCFLGLNAVWGNDFREIDFGQFATRIVNGLRNKNPRSPLAYAIRSRKTLRIGNKYDPFPPRDKGLTRRVLSFLAGLRWDVKLESKNVPAMEELTGLLLGMGATVTTSITCGRDDWALLEGKRTPDPEERLRGLGRMARVGVPVGVITEPFIPGHHTTEEWVDLVRRGKEQGIFRFNVYNLRLTPFVVKRLLGAGLDVEAIWEANQDGRWRPVLRDILEASKRLGVIVGCPDFVNGGDYVFPANTCCGVDVKNPCNFNIINWNKTGLINGKVTLRDFLDSWDGVGDFSEGKRQFLGQDPKKYHLGDTGLFRKEGLEWVIGK